MLVLGVTGQSGSGKGAFCELLRAKGVLCLDTDLTAREVVKPGTECLAKLVARFGLGILLPNGEMDRKKVASIVFSNKDELEFLTKTTHKYIIEKIKEWLLECELDGAKIVAIDAPQLFDAGADFYCNFTLAVLADKAVRTERIVARDGISTQAALARINSQKDDDFFKGKCDYIVYNNGDFRALQKQADKIFAALCEKKEYFE